MQRTIWLGALLLTPGIVEARSFRVNQIPSAPASCNTCHTSGGGTARNVFGQDVERTLDAGNVDWLAVCPLDSDGDDFSNGVELGDPDCTWSAGQGALEAVSIPADPESFPGGTDPLAAADDGQGGCTATPPGLWLAIATTLLVRRARRSGRRRPQI